MKCLTTGAGSAPIHILAQRRSWDWGRKTFCFQPRRMTLHSTSLWSASTKQHWAMTYLQRLEAKQSPCRCRWDARGCDEGRVYVGLQLAPNHALGCGVDGGATLLLARLASPANCCPIFCNRPWGAPCNPPARELSGARRTSAALGHAAAHLVSWRLRPGQRSLCTCAGQWRRLPPPAHPPWILELPSSPGRDCPWDLCEPAGRRCCVCAAGPAPRTREPGSECAGTSLWMRRGGNVTSPARAG
mmetsp:Transcript_29539/g.56773  ORF Transcript_29539/g.56773 Transcript_29539/m.56773 type:complete len:244 (+) Transcript_29539:428-1159(+)